MKQGIALVTMTLVLGALACKPKAVRVCEHARDKYDQMGRVGMELNLRHMSKHDATQARSVGNAGNDEIYANFVPTCLELEGADFDCMETIDRIADPFIAALEAQIDCEQTNPSQRQPCIEAGRAARMKAEADYGPCNLVLRRMFMRFDP